jgi:transposase
MKKQSQMERKRQERYDIIKQMQADGVPITASNVAKRWGVSEAAVYNYYKAYHLSGYSVPPLNGVKPQAHKAEPECPRQPVLTEYPAGLICAAPRPWGDGQWIARVI